MTGGVVEGSLKRRQILTLRALASSFHTGGGPRERIPGQCGGDRYGWTLGVLVYSSLFTSDVSAPSPPYYSSYPL